MAKQLKYLQVFLKKENAVFDYCILKAYLLVYFQNLFARMREKSSLLGHLVPKGQSSLSLNYKRYLQLL